ncbi:hypothetical protein [Phyllobacterium sp. K27]
MVEEQNIWNTKEIILAVVATGIISAVFSALVEFLKAYFKRRGDARYGAMRAAVALEKFAVDCWDALNTADGEARENLETSVINLPKAPLLPDDIDWRSLDLGIADEIMSFVNQNGMAASLAQYARVFERNPYDFHEAVKERGLAALSLAKRVRQSVKIKGRNDFDRIWNDLTK